MTELGTTATTYGWGGFPYDPAEYVPELTYPQNLAIYDKMRTDATVDESYRGVARPVASTGYHFDPNGARPEVIDFYTNMLGLPTIGGGNPPRRHRTRGTIQFTRHINEALLALIYGHAAFEQVWELQADGLMHVTKLASRPVHSIEIKVDERGELAGVKQYVPGGPNGVPRDVIIPADRLVFYSHDREGAAHQGRSMFRSAYKFWYAKDLYMRIDVQAAERHGVGVPMITGPQDATPETLAELAQLAQKYRGGSASGGALPYGTDLNIKGVQGSLHDTLASIRYCDEQIARCALRAFSMLGATSSGSRALGETLKDDFTLGLQAIAEWLTTTLQEQLIEPIGDWNWGPDEVLPVLTHSPIGSDPELTEEGMAALVTAGVLTADDGLEAYVRERFDIPEMDGPRPAPTPAPTVTASGGGTPPFSEARPVRAARKPKPPTHDQLLDLLAEGYGPLIADALGAATDTAALAAAFTAAGLVADAVDLADIVAEWLAGWLADNPLDMAPLSSVFEDLMIESWAAGIDVGAGDVGVETTLSIDWSNWEPGDAKVADLLEDGGLQELLDARDITIKSIEETRVTELGNALADGARDGSSVDEIASNIEGLLTNPERATMIANTELNASMTAATMDVYAEHGTERYDVIAEADACDECEENADSGPYELGEDPPNGLPPTHPSCRCAVTVAER